ncbi:MAG: SagB/ThcOx family dehydrogenase [Candidatus Roizmanbacteria bacterium]|nr:SagB/ThcOx family dehydrogenase [Candidatus Roizmanbacteria bacterium]
MKNGQLNLKDILKVEHNEYERFHTKTTIVPSKTYKVAAKKVYFKAYDRFTAVKLKRSLLPSAFKSILSNRSSQRDIHRSSQLSSKKVGSLLYYSAGMKKYKNPFENYRFYPSAGGRFPLEIYLIANRVEGLAKGGVYHYNVKGDFLEERLPTGKEKISECFQQTFVAQSEAIIVISGIFKRTTMKYGERGYRYTLIESGHVGQNVYLVSEALGLKACGICGFYDSLLNSYLHIDGVSESALYCFTLNS